jgi:hypothetical protein
MTAKRKPNKFQERVKFLQRQGLGSHVATEVAIGEKLLADTVNATTFRQLKRVLGTVIVKQWGTGRAPDHLGRVYEGALLSKDLSPNTVDERIDQLEKVTSPHYGRD